MPSNIFHSRQLSNGTPGSLLEFSRLVAEWDWMGLSVRRITPVEKWEFSYSNEETACVLLSGRCVVDWGEGTREIGQRKTVFDGLPYAAYLSPGKHVTFTGRTECEIAACHVPSQRQFPCRLVTPKDVGVSLRGGGNASRQIVDVMPPNFPADRLMVVEVYTPGGIGRATRRTNTMYTTLRRRSISTKSTTIASATSEASRTSTSIVQMDDATQLRQCEMATRC